MVLESVSVKVYIVLCVIKDHTIKVEEELGLQLHEFFTSILQGGE